MSTVRARTFAEVLAGPPDFEHSYETMAQTLGRNTEATPGSHKALSAGLIEFVRDSGSPPMEALYALADAYLTLARACGAEVGVNGKTNLASQVWLPPLLAGDSMGPRDVLASMLGAIEFLREAANYEPRASRAISPEAN